MRSAEIDTSTFRYIELQGSSRSEHSDYPDNSIVSSKYTYLNFLPKCLTYQFFNPSKLWFLLISILELTNQSTTSMSYGTILPLSLLLVFGLLREALLDYSYHVSDKSINSSVQKVWNGTSFIEVESKNILVGDIVLLKNNEISPADMVILCAGNEERECYADVSAVIGESNLKLKHPVKEIQNILDTIDLSVASHGLANINAELLVNLPNKSFKQFNGKLKLPISPKASALDINHLLLRGMKINHTEWIFGLVIYAGIETKVWINNLVRPAKVPQIRKIMDIWMLFMFPVILIISTTNTIIFELIPIYNYKWYEIFVANLILFSHMVQISLYITIEIMKIIALLFNGHKNLKIRNNTTNLLANLGMVEYLVTDKTGTLTENALDIALIAVNDQIYFNDYEVAESEESERNNSMSRLNPTRAPSHFLGEIHGFKELFNNFCMNPENDKFLKFFTCLAICNLAFPENDDFVAISVDDKILARTAANFGIRLMSRDSETCVISVHGKEILYQVLGTQAFSSDIKKSRIVVKNSLNNSVFMFIKGSRDSMIKVYDSLTYNRLDFEDAIIQYRTLFLGVKEMNKKEANEFVFEYETSQLSPVNKQGRVENVFQKYEKGSEFIGIIGLEDTVTEETKEAVHCLKQAGIKFWVVSGDSEESTLTSSIAAGIFSTENNIIRLVNFSSELDCMNELQTSIRENIFPEYFAERVSFEEEKKIPQIKSEVAIPAAPSIVSVRSVEDAAPLAFSRRNGRRSTLFARAEPRRSTVHPLISKLSMFNRKTSLEGEYNPKKLKFILSVDSTGLEYGTSSKEHLKYFTSLLFTAKAVCFHSLLPDQKTKVIKLIKHNFRFRPLVMSIGDGISDIGMIQQADISAGILGKQGSEAALSADVSISHFSQLKYLLLIYGHGNYVQLSKMILQSFYVMILLETELFCYNPMSSWTAQSILEKEFLLVFRLVVNVLPIAGLCVLDKEIFHLMNPAAYKAGIFNCLMTLKNLSFYVVTALMQGGFTFLLTELFFSSYSANGRTENAELIGSSVFFILSVTAYATILYDSFTITWKIVLYFGFCLGVQMAAVIPLAYTSKELYGYSQMINNFGAIWFYLIFTTLVNVTISYFFKSFKYTVAPGSLEKAIISSDSQSLKLDSRVGHYCKTLKSVYKESAEWKHQSSYDSGALNHKTLKFMSKYKETIYQADKLAENSKNFRILLLIGGVSVSIYTIYVLLTNYASTAAIAFHISSSVLLFISFLLPSLPNFWQHSLAYLITTYTFLQAFYLISQVAFGFSCLSMCTYLPALYLIGFSNHWLEMTLLVIASNVISAIIAFYEFSKSSNDTGFIILETFVYSVSYLSLCLTTSLVAYHLDKSKRLEFVLVQQVQVEIQKSKSVLSYLLPAFVTKRVQDGVRYISDYQGVVSVIFCDIHNFESILKFYNPNELTAFLDELYGKFDQWCLLSGCTKIETVGKTYMACAGLRDSEREMNEYYREIPHARRCIEMGLSIIKNSEKFYLKNKETLQFKIGINSGPVTAGVVGLHKPQFSLVGDTVNTASRMASLCSKPNTLQISTETFDLIGNKNGLVFDPSEIDAKGKGILKTFLVSVPEAPVLFSPTKTLSEVYKPKGNDRPSKKITLYQLNNLHSDHDKRKSSVIDDLEAVVADDNEFVRKETETLEKIKWFYIGCRENSKEKTFRIETSEATYPIVKYGMIIRIVTNGVFVIFIIIELARGHLSYQEEIFTLVIEASIFSCVLAKFNTYYKTIWYCWLISWIYLIGAVYRFSITYLNSNIIFIGYIFHSFEAAHCSQLLFKYYIWPGSLAVLAQIVSSVVIQQPLWLLQILASLLFFVILLFTIYTREQKLRYFATLKSAAEKKLKASEELLTQMMPKHVFENLKENYSVTEDIKNVTVLYADIVGFTQWSSEKPPDEVVDMLSDLFTEFDRKCIEYGVYKVHTIGDCYVSMGYTGTKPRQETAECFKLAQFALALVDIIKEKNNHNGTSLNMRIGMHTGDIIGGIAGTNIVRYDIYGVDVYIANKMESKSRPGCIKVSESCKNILQVNWPKTFIFTYDEDVFISINNTWIKTYFLEANVLQE